MRKGDKVEITEKARYNGQDMAWTEDFSHTEILPAGTILYHFSDRKIKAFYPKETCFFPEKDRSYGYVYAFVLKTDVKAKYYKSGEYRFIISDKNTEVIYIGKREYLGKGKIADKTIKIKKEG